MKKLLPCPFCGCEAEIITTESIHGGYLFGIMCKYCRSRGDFHRTEEQAIDAWNSRAERPCKLVYGENDDGADGWYTQCGGWFAATFENGRMVHPTYCPNCGRKAVKR